MALLDLHLSWAAVATPVPTGAQNARLYGVSCVSSTWCIAVGGWSANDNMQSGTMSLRWNGTTWTVLTTTPPPAGSAAPALTGVSCSSSSACTAVGGYGGEDFTSGAIIERWNGTTWALQSSPTPASALLSVACPTAVKCVAVGSAWATYSALANVWDGTTWTAQTRPASPGATGAQLQGVACLSATSCEAVGQQSASGLKTLADGYTG